MRAPTMSVGESIGQRLRRLRLEKGLSQRELAGPGVSYAYVSRIEGGQRHPSLRAIRVLARRLGVSAQYLETGSMTTDRKSTRLNSSHPSISYAVFCLKKKKKNSDTDDHPSSSPTSHAELR